MRMTVGLEDGLSLDGDWCMRDTPTVSKEINPLTVMTNIFSH